MTEADPFLTAIASSPRDATLRLVYADWLEERNDPRHELVRVCERMRQVPVYSDDYWRLKARRNDLRAGCPADWLAATGYDGSGYDPVFRDGVPDDWTGRWRVVREFTERWHGVPMPDIGGRPEEVRAAEERLGVALPPSVREYVAFAHDMFTQHGRPIVIRDVYQMERMADHPAISLLVLGEGNVLWAVKLADLNDPDPLVYEYVWDGEYDGPDETRPYTPDSDDPGVPVSRWALSYVECYKPGSNFATTVRGVDLLRELEAEFPIHRPTLGGDGRGRFEHPAGVLASLYPDPNSDWRGGGPHFRLEVHVRQGVAWQAVPEFLWEYARRRHSCRGMFLTQQSIDNMLAYWGDGPIPDWVPREAVPPMREPASHDFPDDIPF